MLCGLKLHPAKERQKTYDNKTGEHTSGRRPLLLYKYAKLNQVRKSPFESVTKNRGERITVTIFYTKSRWCCMYRSKRAESAACIGDEDES